MSPPSGTRAKPQAPRPPSRDRAGGILRTVVLGPHHSGGRKRRRRCPPLGRLEADTGNPRLPGDGGSLWMNASSSEPGKGARGVP